MTNLYLISVVCRAMLKIVSAEACVKTSILMKYRQKSYIWFEQAEVCVYFHGQKTPLKILLGYLDAKLWLLFLKCWSHWRATSVLRRHVKILTDQIFYIGKVEPLVCFRETISVFGDTALTAMSGTCDLPQSFWHAIDGLGIGLVGRMIAWTQSQHGTR